MSFSGTGLRLIEISKGTEQFIPGNEISYTWPMLLNVELASNQRDVIKPKLLK